MSDTKPCKKHTDFSVIPDALLAKKNLFIKIFDMK